MGELETKNRIDLKTGRRTLVFSSASSFKMVRRVPRSMKTSTRLAMGRRTPVRRPRPVRGYGNGTLSYSHEEHNCRIAVTDS